MINLLTTHNPAIFSAALVKWLAPWRRLRAAATCYLLATIGVWIACVALTIPPAISLLTASHSAWAIILCSIVFLVAIIIVDPICIELEGLPYIGIVNAVILASAFILPGPMAFLVYSVARLFGQQLPPRRSAPARWFNSCLPLSILAVIWLTGIFKPLDTVFSEGGINLFCLPLILLAASTLEIVPLLMTSVMKALADNSSLGQLLITQLKLDFAVSIAMTSSGAIIACLWTVSPILVALVIAPGVVFWSSVKGVKSKHEANVLTTFSDQLRSVLSAEARVKFDNKDSGVAVLPLLEASLALTAATQASLYLRKGIDGRIEEALRCNKDGIVKDKISSVLVADDWDVVSQKNGVVIVPLLLSDSEGVTGVIRLTGLTGTVLNSYQLEVLKILGAHTASTVENERLHTELQLLARRDELTGALNRRAFDETLQYEGNRINRYGPPMCLLYIDLDHFKSINDTSGHAAGDAALKAVSKALTASVRSVDSVGRLGGDEFAVLLPLTELCDGEVTAERIRANLAKIEAVDEGGNKIAVACSIGLASMPQHARNVKDLMASADRAVYAAKKSGRGFVSIADILAVDVAS